MALDEAMLLSAHVRQEAAFRFYEWSEPTVSLGYFQSRQDHEQSQLRKLAWVRRSSGGAAILHHAPHELTYSFALPLALAKIQRGESWICRVHHAIRDWLKCQSILTRAVVCGEEQKKGEYLCFLHQTAGDLILNGSKIAGSAQRKHQGSLLQHGTILLTTSPYTSELPGLGELSGKLVPRESLCQGILETLGTQFGWDFRPDDWTQDEQRQANHIEAEKYRTKDWNERR